MPVAGHVVHVLPLSALHSIVASTPMIIPSVLPRALGGTRTRSDADGAAGPSAFPTTSVISFVTTLSDASVASTVNWNVHVAFGLPDMIPSCDSVSRYGLAYATDDAVGGPASLDDRRVLCDALVRPWRAGSGSSP